MSWRLTWSLIAFILWQQAHVSFCVFNFTISVCWKLFFKTKCCHEHELAQNTKKELKCFPKRENVLLFCSKSEKVLKSARNENSAELLLYWIGSSEDETRQNTICTVTNPSILPLGPYFSPLPTWETMAESITQSGEQHRSPQSTHESKWKRQLTNFMTMLWILQWEVGPNFSWAAIFHARC